MSGSQWYRGHSGWNIEYKVEHVGDNVRGDDCKTIVRSLVSLEQLF